VSWRAPRELLRERISASFVLRSPTALPTIFSVAVALSGYSPGPSTTRGILSAAGSAAEHAELRGCGLQRP